MKKTVLLWMALLVSVFVSAQNLSVSQLLELSDKGLGEVQENLSKLDWHFYQATDETEKAFGNAKFVFNISDFEPGVTIGKYFITYYISEAQDAMAISMLFQDSELFKSFSTQLENLKFKLESSKPENGNIIKVFTRRSYVVKVTIPPNMEGNNSYQFLFAKKSNYKKL